MPTRNPRVNITLTPERFDLLTRLGKVQSCSRSAVVVELLDMVAPVWERVVVVAEAAQRAKVQAKEGLLESLDRAEAAILPHVMQAEGQLDLLLQDVLRRLPTTQGPGPAPSPSRAAERSTRGRVRSQGGRDRGPRPVIRGPGRGAKGAGGRTRKGVRP
jgi:hypothetical protein